MAHIERSYVDRVAAGEDLQRVLREAQGDVAGKAALVRSLQRQVSEREAEVERLREELVTPPDDPRNCWRIIDYLGVWREVASEANAREKAAAYDRSCPPRERPHRVEHWTGSEWVGVDPLLSDAAVRAATDRIAWAMLCASGEQSPRKVWAEQADEWRRYAEGVWESALRSARDAR